MDNISQHSYTPTPYQSCGTMMKSRKTTFTISGTQSPKLTKLHKNLRGNLIPAGQSGDFFLQKIEEFYFVNIKNLRL
jgi:hypothetical protein